MRKLTTLVAALTLAALASACGGDDATNANRTTNTTTNNTSTVATPNANANRGVYNANISQEDYDKDKETFGQKAKDLGDKVGSGLTDGWLWVKARGALLAADDLEESGINVDVANGIITLRGTVPSADQLKKADAAIKGLGGSKGVQNQLKVSPGGNDNANRTAPSKK